MYRYREKDIRLVQERVSEFRDQVRRRLGGELSEDEFRPLRLMNGLYLQRHAYMLRIGIPYGLLNSRQVRKLAYIAERYDRGYGHMTTRQNIQFNWIKLEEVPEILGHLAEVEMHAIQTSGNCVRNITNDPHAGVADDEIFDTRPLSELIRQYKEIHPEFMYLPRKFKIAMTGATTDRAATAFHDIGLRATLKDGEPGFEVHVGGGMGRTPRIAKMVRDFLPIHDVIGYVEAILRVYNLHGRRDNKYRARIKILVGDMGVDAFRDATEKEFELIRDENRISQEAIDAMEAEFSRVDYEPDANQYQAFQTRRQSDVAFDQWLSWNVKGHKVPGYNIVYLSLKAAGRPPGDATSEQFAAIADLMDRYNQGYGVATYNQNLCLQFVRNADLSDLYDALASFGLATANIDTISDLICCPGLDFCSLANTVSIPIAQKISERFKDLDKVYNVGRLHLNMSGCINACGHHHTGHIGILGVDKRGEEYFQIVLGGHAGSNEQLPARIGEVIGPAVSADAIVDLVERIVEHYVAIRHGAESFIETIQRVGTEPFAEVAYE